MLDKAETTRGDTAMCFALANLLFHTSAKANVPGARAHALMKQLLGVMHERCPFTVPEWPSPADLGYGPDGKLVRDTKDKWGAAAPRKDEPTLLPDNKVFGIAQLWAWLARAMNNTEAPVHSCLAPAMVAAVLQVAGPALCRAYGKQMHKLLQCCRQHWLPLCADNAIATPYKEQLRLIIDDYARSGRFEEPKGITLVAQQSSSLALDQNVGSGSGSGSGSGGFGSSGFAQSGGFAQSTSSAQSGTCTVLDCTVIFMTVLMDWIVPVQAAVSGSLGLVRAVALAKVAVALVSPTVASARAAVLASPAVAVVLDRAAALGSPKGLVVLDKLAVRAVLEALNFSLSTMLVALLLLWYT
ncbi:MAG: hypothetical protein MHM6MM_008086 [Cercozoa sp. M6MM]